MNENEKKEVQKMIDTAISRAMDYRTRKRGDTPTDDQQLTPRKYVNMFGSIAGRPQTSIITQVGQQYFATDASNVGGGSTGYPIFRNSLGSWVTATGSTVASN